MTGKGVASPAPWTLDPRALASSGKPPCSCTTPLQSATTIVYSPLSARKTLASVGSVHPGPWTLASVGSVHPGPWTLDPSAAAAAAGVAFGADG